jgi:hypothetical protein
LLYKCCTCNLSLKPFHGGGHHFRRSFNVAALSRAHVLVPEYRLNHNIRNTEFVQVRGEAPTISVPAFSRQTVCLEHWLNHTISEVVQIQRPANRVGEHPSTRKFRLDRIEHSPKRLDDWHDTGVIVILVGLGLLFHVSPPDRRRMLRI